MQFTRWPLHASLIARFKMMRAKKQKVNKQVSFCQCHVFHWKKT